MSDLYQRIYQTVRRIPRGKVATYGQIAALIGSPRAARAVGFALHALPNGGDVARNVSTVPWWRVVNRQGYITTTCQDHPADWQKTLLEREGVTVEKTETLDRVELGRFLWRHRRTS